MTNDLSFNNVISKSFLQLKLGLNCDSLSSGVSGSGCRYTSERGMITLEIPAKIAKVVDNPLCSTEYWTVNTHTTVLEYWPAVHMPFTSAKCLGARQNKGYIGQRDAQSSPYNKELYTIKKT